MTTNQMFDHAINAQKAKAFDFMAEAFAKLQVAHTHQQKAVDLWLQECDWCQNGSGRVTRLNSQGGNEELVDEECQNCQGTGKIPK
jgi:DnaJ-class molecular chaperone